MAEAKTGAKATTKKAAPKKGGGSTEERGYYGHRAEREGPQAHAAHTEAARSA